MPPGFAVRLKVSRKASKRLSQQSRNAGNLAPALRLFGAHMLRSVAKNFALSGRRDGATGVWPALSETTIALRRTGDEGAPDISPMPLDDTGTLKNSITFKAGARTLTVGTDVPYGPDHQQEGAFGTKMAIVETVEVEAHTRAETQVAAHNRTTKDGRAVSVAAHTRKAHQVVAYSLTRRFDLPARPFLRFHRNDLAHARRILSAYLEGGLPAAIAAAAKGIA